MRHDDIHRSPKISVVVVVLNGKATIQRCFESIERQTYENFELIVIDGASDDGTVDVIREFSQGIAYWKSEPDRGISDAWNKALDVSTGDWICFLGADDFLWDTNTLANAAKHLSEIDSRIRVAYGKVALVGADGSILGVYGESWARAGPKFRQLMSIPHQGTFHRRSLFRTRGYFDTDYKMGGDYELLLRELKDGRAVFLSDVVVAGMGYGGMTSNPENSLKGLMEIRRAQRKNGIPYPGLGWSVSMLKAVTRMAIFRLFGRRLGGKLVDCARWLRRKEPFWSRAS